MTDPHHHRLHQAPSTSNPSHASNNSIESTQSSGTRGRFRSKINKLVLRSGQSPSKSTRSISAPSPAADSFKIVHEPDTMPLYSPPRPMMPRTESECEEALEEMFSYTRDGRRPSTAPSEGPFSRIRTLSDQKKPPVPPLPPPKDGIVPPRSFPRPLNTNIPLQPPRTAGARLESIPGSPLSPSTIRSMPTPTRHQFARTPRTVNSNKFQRAMTGDAIRAPRPLSERAMIPLDSVPRVKQGQDAHLVRSPLGISATLTTSPTRTEFTRSISEDGNSRSQMIPNAPSRPRERRHSPLSPLRQSPPTILSCGRPTYTAINETINPRRPSRPTNQEYQPPSLRWSRPHPQISFDSMRADDRVVTSSDDDANGDGESTRTMSSSRRIPDFSAKCYMCPEPCSPSRGLCPTCQERFRPQNTDFYDSDSEYEDIEVHTPSVSPRRTKTKPLSVQTTTHAHGGTGLTASPGPVTPVRYPSFSRPLTPTRSPPQRAHSSSPRTPETPRGWARPSSPPRQGQAHDLHKRSLSNGPPQHPKALSSPAPIQPPASSQPGSALFHLERSMQWGNWEPLTPSASPKNGYDVVRVGSVLGGEAQKVVMRDSSDEGADTMKMLANEEGEEERRSGGGGGYGDWFSYYAEKEGREAQKRTSAGSSIYERIQSIYDAYAGVEGEDEDRDAGMF